MMMMFRHNKTLLPALNSIAKVTALAWSPNSQRLAAVTIARIVYLFDEVGDLRDKFATKPADSKGSRLYIITGMVFSPDSTKLALLQSDDIIFVYKIGLDWGDKKSICNKFHQNLPIMSICWPKLHPHEVLFGLSDGKVKVGQLRTNRTATMHAHSSCSPVVSLTSSPDGSTIIAGHLDGSIYRFIVDKSLTTSSAFQIANHGCVPTILSWGVDIIAAGPDCKVVFYDIDGTIVQQFDYSEAKVCPDFSASCFNPNGDVAVLSCSDGFQVFRKNLQDMWEDSSQMELKNLYTVSSLAWKPDGSQLVLGGLCGNIEMLDACIRRQYYQGKYEFIYTTRSQVVVRNLTSPSRFFLQSYCGLEIEMINIYLDQYIVAQTPDSLLLGNMKKNELSEISWSFSGREKFLFENSLVCMIHDKGELTIVEYGCNDVLGTCRTEHINSSLISFRVNETLNSISLRKTLAFLIDMQMIQILEFPSGLIIGAINHETPIEWLQLNPQASHLLFCDKRRQLYLVDLSIQESKKILAICKFAQWVPDCNVIIAQSYNNMCIWYSIQHPEHAVIIPIKGNLEGIRHEGKLEVIVNEGYNNAIYSLDEALIALGSAIENSDLDMAALILEKIGLSPMTELIGRQLALKAVQKNDFLCAERCFTVIEDISKATYIQKVKDFKLSSLENKKRDAKADFVLQAKLAVLQHQWKIAETVLMSHGDVTELIHLLTKYYRWRDAIWLARNQYYHNTESLQDQYHEWLQKSGQFDEVGREKESVNDTHGAIQLYLQSGFPTLAADCVARNSESYLEDDAFHKTVLALQQHGMMEKLGELWEKLGFYEKALETYEEGCAYHHAIVLANQAFPENVIKLKEGYADWLVSKNQEDAAVNMYLEAGCVTKAIHSCIASLQWSKAVQIAETQAIEVAKPFYKILSQHFISIKQLSEAEKLLIKANLFSEAVSMYINLNKMDSAFKVAQKHLSEEEASKIYLKRAMELETSKYFRDAERLYVESNHHDLAILMYKKERLFDDVIRLVRMYQMDKVKDVCVAIAQQLENEGLFREAEKFYLETQDWKSIVKMYSIHAMWEDAMRVGKHYGGSDGMKQVACTWAESLGGETGVELLANLGMVEQAIMYAIDVSAFNRAFELCRTSFKEKIPEVHLKFAMFLEDEGYFKEAEEEYIKAGKPREAIEMYMNQQNWEAAMNVADLFDPSCISHILVYEAQLFTQTNQFDKAEALFIQAKRADLAINMYKNQLLWEDALRVAHNYFPEKVCDIQLELASFMKRNNKDADNVQLVLAKGKALEQNHNFVEAIELYLEQDNNSISDFANLKEIWQMAISLVEEQFPERLSEVVNAVVEQLVSLGKLEEAAELYENIGCYKEGINIYIKGDLWEQAQKLATNSNDADLQKEVDAAYKDCLLKKGQASQLVHLGSIHEAIELYVDQDDWKQVHDLAVQLGPDSVKEFSLRHAAKCLQDSKSFEAISIMSRYGIPANEDAIEMCMLAARQILSIYDDSPEFSHVIKELRMLLYDIVQTIKQSENSPSDSGVLKDLEMMLLPVTYISLRYDCENEGLLEIAAKLCISLLRYIQLIPADKAFYEAGMTCKKVGQFDKAFAYLNRYLDIAEAIDDGEGIVLDSPAFEISDIPHNFFISPKHSIDEDRREEAKEWLIQFSMRQQVEQVSFTRTCEGCGNCAYEASLMCFVCKMESTPCCVTGFPLEKDRQTKCCACNALADSNDWITYTQAFKTCPSCFTKM